MKVIELILGGMMAIKKISEEGAALQTVRQLFSEYQQELGEDLCFQSFADELNAPLEKYGAPDGAVYLASWNDEPAGCVALKKIGEGVCEMKRLYVRPAFRKHGLGKALVGEIIAAAAAMNYTWMKLDTLRRLEAAIKLYEAFGFVHTQAYYDNPLNDVVYMQLDLQRSPARPA